MARFLLPMLLLLSYCYRSGAYYITVDAHAEECFYETVEAGTKMGLTFEIAEGGFLDIDVNIAGPDGKILHKGEQESNGKYTFAANIAGEYTYCFSNQKSTLTPKVIKFNMDVELPKKPKELDPNAKGDEGDANHGKLDDMIKDLSTSLWGVKNEQEYMQVRDSNHRAINESTNYHVVLWSIFEASVLLSMTLGQVFYLKRFFEVRRVV